MSYEPRAWWKVQKKGAYRKVIEAIDSIVADQPYRYESHLHHTKMYSNREAEHYFGEPVNMSSRGDRLTMNICKEIIDTMVAHYGLQAILPMAITDNGDWTLRARGEKINTFLNGMFRSLQLFRKGPLSIRDGCIHSKGATYFYNRDGKIYAERVFTPEILFDESEAMDQNPRHMFRIRDIERNKLLEDSRYSHLKKIILKAKRLDLRNGGVTHADYEDSNLVTLVEAWRLPSECGTTKGRYVKILSCGDLEDKKYTRQKYPFSFFEYPGDEGKGVWGASVIDNQQARQIEINRLLQKIQRQMRSSSLKIMVERGSKIVKENWTNEDGTFIYYDRTPPQAVTMASVAPETFKQLMQLRQDAFESEGVNRLSSHGELPPGIKSGVAQSTYIEEGTKRLRYLGKAVEWYYVDCAHQIIDNAKEIDEAGEGSFEIMAETDDGLEKIKWSDVSLEDDKYQIAIKPSNFFSQSIAMKFEQANEMLDREIISLDEWSSVMDNPDLKAITRRRNSGYREIELAIQDMKDGKSVVPDGTFTNLEMAGPLVHLAYLESKNAGAPEEVLDNFRNYLLIVSDEARKQQEEMQAKEMQLAAAQAGPPQGAPPAAEGGPPPGPPGEMPMPPDMPQLPA